MLFLSLFQMSSTTVQECLRCRIAELNHKVSDITSDLSSAEKSSDTLQTQLRDASEKLRNSEQSGATQLQVLYAAQHTLPAASQPAQSSLQLQQYPHIVRSSL